ncbi:MAG: YdeI/OmpD-associated family protein [Blastocatellia bacterium]
MSKTLKQVKFKTELSKSPVESGWRFLIVPKAIEVKFGFEGKSRRVVCSINGSESFQCALLPWGDMFYIIVNKKKRDALGIVVGDTVDVVLVKDESKYGLPVPEDFEEVLQQDEEGSRLFHALTAGKQRSLLYMIGSVKNIDRRIHLGLIVLEHLKENGGKIVGERLQQDIKRPVF